MSIPSRKKAATSPTNDETKFKTAMSTAVAPTPKPIESVDDVLVGGSLDEGALGRVADATMAAAEPICDVRGSADFRREIVGVLTRRALITACHRAKETK